MGLALDSKADVWRDDLRVAAYFALAIFFGTALKLWTLDGLLLGIWFDAVLNGVRHMAMLIAATRHRGESVPYFREVPFFIVHYGGFSAGALLILSVVFATKLGLSADLPAVFSPTFGIAGQSILILIVFAAWQGLLLRRFFERNGAATLTPRDYFGPAYLRLVGTFGGALLLSSWLSGADPLVVAGAVVCWWWAIESLVGAWPMRDQWAPWRIAAKNAIAETGEVYDVRNLKSPRGQNLFVGVGLLFSFIGFVMIFASWWGVLWLAFSGLWTWFAATALQKQYKELREAMASGRCQIAEGAVTDFSVEDRGRHGLVDNIKVAGVPFAINGTYNQGYSKIVSSGGVLREGVRVRLHYLPSREGNIIARAELLDRTAV